MMTSPKKGAPMLLVGVIIMITGVQSQMSLDGMLGNFRPEESHTFPPRRTTTPSPPFTGNVYERDPNLISDDPNYDARSSALVSKAVLKMAHDISKELLRSRPYQKSQVISPVSIAATLSLVMLGAKGQTYNELLHAFGLDSDQLLRSTPYKIHEEFGILLDDLIADYPARLRQVVPWRTKPYRYNRRPDPESRFNFPDEEPVPSRQHSMAMRMTRLEDHMNNIARNGNDHHIYTASGIFVQNGYSFRPDYKTIVESVYKSQIMTLDFQNNPSEAASYINNWVSKNTNGKIQSIVDQSLPTSTKTVLASALYFKALWDKSFFDGATITKDFYPDGLSGRTIPVQMMAHGGTFPFYNSVEYDCRILGLPYKQNLTTMYIILPNNSNKMKLQELQATLTAEKIEEMITRMELKTTILLFPKMHMTYSIDLTQILRTMGINSLFNPMMSDLSLISTGYEQTQSDQPMTPYLTSGFVAAPQLMAKMEMSPPQTYDVDGEPQFVFSRISTDDDDKSKSDSRKRRDISYKVESSFKSQHQPLRMKDFVINKRITKPNPLKKQYRNRREATDTSQLLKNIETLRLQDSRNPGLFADQVLHKIDLTINEKGTEGGASTTVILTKTGTDVVFRTETPFMFLIRHDETKLPLFYGTVYEPEIQ